MPQTPSALPSQPIKRRAYQPGGRQMTAKLRSVFWAFPQRLASDTRGVTLPLVAASITALIGFTGLAVESGYWYAIKRYNQSAADVAALSGAMEKAGGKTYPDICNLAKLAAKA